MSTDANKAGKRYQATGLHNNGVSYSGGLITIAGLVLEIALVIIHTATGGRSPYIGIFAYMLFPFLILTGLLVFLYGMRRESIRRRRLGPAAGPAYPRIDLNDRTQRSYFQFALGGLVLAGFLLVYVAYRGFLFTESVTFCGTLCHTVMQPEYTAYSYSPHARVPCVACHVGPGVPWYVKSKLSGVEQVFAVLLDNYDRPIPTPISELRPAREICEQCHWPSQFYGAVLKRVPHFDYDRQNTAEEIVFILKIGGAAPTRLNEAGIHWHMIEGVTVEYRAADAKRQVIPWCRVTRQDGTTAEYRSRDTEYSLHDLKKMALRVMDCMDCHNRPTHIFPPADDAVNAVLADGEIPHDLPWIKKTAMDTLLASYPEGKEAGDGIRKKITGFYQSRYPALFAKRKSDVEKTAKVIDRIRSRSVFPDMRVTWDTYPNNLGHRNWAGCFRCHDGLHKTPAGKILKRDCNLCHTPPVRSRLSPVGSGILTGSDNWHDWELADRHAKLLCDQCHRADWKPILDCAGCHGLDEKAPMMTDLSCEDCHLESQFVKPLADCRSCHQPGGLHTKKTHAQTACITCHPPHAWLLAGRDPCLQCHTNKKNHHAGEEACFNCHKFREDE